MSGPGSIAARRRPDALVAVFLLEAVIAWVLAAPWAETISRVFGAHPDGDRALFWRPGGHLLLDLAQRLSGVLSALVASTAIGLTVFALGSVVVVGAWLAALDEPALGLGDAFARGLRSFFRLLGVGVVTTFCAGVTFGLLGLIPAWGLGARLEHWDPRRALLVSALPLVVAFALVVLIVAIADLARAHVVRHDATVLEGLSAAMRDRARLLAFVTVAAPRWLASLGLLGWGAAITTKTNSLALIFVVHQLIAFARVALRGSVLARALRVTADTASLGEPAEPEGSEPEEAV